MARQRMRGARPREWRGCGHAGPSDRVVRRDGTGASPHCPASKVATREWASEAAVLLYLLTRAFLSGKRKACGCGLVNGTAFYALRSLHTQKIMHGSSAFKIVIKRRCS